MRRIATVLSGIALIGVAAWAVYAGVLTPLEKGVTSFFAEAYFERNDSPIGFWLYVAAAAFTALILIVVGLYALIGGLLGYVTLESIEVDRGRISVDGIGTDGDD